VSGLPAGWALASVGDLVERVEAGLNVKCIERPPESGERGLVKISAVTSGRFEQDKSKTLPKGIEVDVRNRIAPGDLLFSRANTIELVGACALVDRVDRTLYLSDKVLRLVAPLKTKRWLNLALKTPDARRAIAEASSGNQLSMRNIAQDRLRALPVPVAPLAEQQRIADKLEAVLGRVDACRDLLDHVGPLLKRFRQSVLQAATTGSLTDSWRQLHGERPWLESTLGELGLVSGGLTKNSRREALATRYRYLRVANVYANRLQLADVSDIGATEAEFRRTRLEDGDLLIVEGNGSIEQVGRVAMWRGALPDCSHQNHLIRWRAGPDALPAYLLYWLMSPIGRTALMARASSSSGLHTLSIGKVGTIAISTPSVAEQASIVAEVQRLFELADRLEARLRTAQRLAARLTPALLAKAFRGELVPQDPADEPAQALLDRVRAARASKPPGRLRRQPAGA